MILRSHQLAIIQQCQESDIQQLKLEVATRRISQLPFENSRITTTFSEQPRSRQDQVMAFKNEMSEMAQTISNPVRRSVFEMAISTAIQQIDDRLGTEAFTEAHDSTDSNPEETNPKDTSSKDTQPEDTSLNETSPKVSDFISKGSYSRHPDWKIHIVTEERSKLENMFCTVYVTSKTTLLKSRYNQHRKQYKHDLFITICPAWWLVKLGISYAPRGSLSHSTISGWKHKFNPYRLVSSDALIFEFCRNNNLAGVQTLLSRGEASVKDMDSLGQTPLHVSQFIRSNIFKCLF